MRILVTGSRDWDEYEVVQSALVAAVQGHIAKHPELQHQFVDWPTVVHGGCPTGADRMAHDFCRNVVGWSVEVWPADWSQGRRAGPDRNAHMVSLGADVCLAFIGPCTSPRCHRTDPHDSHGATGCADLAEAAGIPTYRFPASTRAAS